MAHHAIAAHATTMALAGGGTFATVVYLDHSQMRRWYQENEQGLKIDRTIKFAIAGASCEGTGERGTAFYDSKGNPIGIAQSVREGATSVSGEVGPCVT